MPNVYEYLDYRCYLRDFYKELKGKNRACSYNYLAMKAGFKSKSFFYEVLTGKKKLSGDSVFALQKFLKLNEKAFSYFETLVQFNQTTDPAQKEHFFKLLTENYRLSPLRLITKDQYDYFAQWHHSTIRELVTLIDFNDDYALLGRMVRPAISAKEAKASVKLLQRLGFIRKNGNKYEMTDISITTGDEVSSIAVKKFHAMNLTAAAAALYTCPAQKRDISNIIGALSPEGFATVKCEIQRFRKKLLDIIDKDKNRRIVCTINFQLFPTSEETPQ